MMQEKTFPTPSGSIRYWVSSQPAADLPWLVFLPGLTADHRLFDKQVEFFDGGTAGEADRKAAGKETPRRAGGEVANLHDGQHSNDKAIGDGISPRRANCLVWDPPSHGLSRPFKLDWTLLDLADMLHGILEAEGIGHPVLVGQSMGGYVSQAFMEHYPGMAAGFVSIDSCPLKREYYSWWELAMLRHTKLMYLSIPWGTLVKLGSSGNTTTSYGAELMRAMMLDYGKREYCELADHGFRVLADAVEANLPYEISCPALIVCGEEDRAGSAKRYNRAWEAREEQPVHWIPDAGHNSNCDAPDAVNRLIEKFVGTLDR